MRAKWEQKWKKLGRDPFQQPVGKTKQAKENRKINEAAVAVFATAQNIHAIGGRVPETKAELKAAGLPDKLCDHFAQDVFGCTEIIPSLHLRKVLVALDMIDWESAGFKKKHW